ncbi:MAG: methyltransferase domain-containing protein [Chthoniobacteraceae bacterium]
MRKPEPRADWPQSWKDSWPYDAEEVFGPINCRGYAYAYANRRKQTLDLIQRVIPPGARVLDVAAAQGNFSLALAEMGYRVTWNDLRAELEDYVRLKWEQGSIEYAAGNVFDLNLGPEFDVVLIAEIIEHVAHPDEFLSRIGKLVKPGGHIVMTTPNGGYFLNRLPKFSDCRDPCQFEAFQFKPNSDGHIFLLHEDEIPVLAARAGLEVRKISLATNFLTNGHLKTEEILRRSPRAWIDAIERMSSEFPGPIRRRLHTAMAVLLQRPREC